MVLTTFPRTCALYARTRGCRSVASHRVRLPSNTLSAGLIGAYPMRWLIPKKQLGAASYGAHIGCLVRTLD
jgi:hypothetical protein